MEAVLQWKLSIPDTLGQIKVHKDPIIILYRRVREFEYRCSTVYRGVRDVSTFSM